MMEEQIKYILDMSCEHFVAMPSKCKQRAAKEITAHVMEFIEWKDCFTNFDIEEQLYFVMIETHIVEKMTLEGAYQYWLTNVKK